MDRREALKAAGLMLGYTLTGSALVIWDGCKAGQQLDWKPQFFTNDEILLISEITEIILPKTDTPGAKDAQCDKYIDAAVSGFFSKEDQDHFRNGLKIFNQKAKNKFSKSFMALNPNEMEKVLDLVVEDMKAQSNDQKHIFQSLKELTIMGYCTSETGSLGGLLDYRPVPGPYQGCIEYSTIGKAWVI